MQEFVEQLRRLQFASWTTVFGAELLWSVLPLLILLSSLANDRIDDDLSRNIGLNSQGARVVRELFRSSPVHPIVPILTGLIFAFAGTMAVVSSVQLLYERLFRQEHRGWRGFLRSVVWVVVLVAVLVVQAVVDKPVRTGAGPVVLGLVRFVMATAFFWWTMHFLLAGRVPWRLLVRPAVATALLWLGLAVFSSFYFSPLVVSDSKQFGTIGVVFSLLTWFILIGGVIMLGAAGGAVWQDRRGGAAQD